MGGVGKREKRESDSGVGRRAERDEALATGPTALNKAKHQTFAFIFESNCPICRGGMNSSFKAAGESSLGACLNFTGLTMHSLSSIPEYAVRVRLNKHGISIDKGAGRAVNRVKVPLSNGRCMQTSLDREGMKLVMHPYPHVDYYDQAAVVATYYAQLRQIIMENIEGARDAIVAHHQVRSHKKDILQGGTGMPKDPVHFCHCDYSLAGGYSYLRRLGESTHSSTTVLSQEDIEYYSTTGRFMIVHAWRNISPRLPVQSNPLALCCANTVHDDDLVAYNLCYDQRTDGVMAIKHNSAQQWLYFPDMVRDELLIFKQFDSISPTIRRHSLVAVNTSPDAASETVSCWVPHSSFENSNDMPKDKELSPPAGRETIEAAVVVLF